MRTAISKRFYSTVIVLGLLLCLCASLCILPSGRAVLVWQDNFNDGDYSGWTVFEGSFSATNNRLESGPDVWNSAHHTSTVAEGEWRFDAHYDAIAGMMVAFIAADITGTSFIKPQNGYILEISQYDQTITLYRHVSGVESHMDTTSMGFARNFRFIVTRDSSGQFYVWINGTLRLDAVSTHVSTSSYFFVTMVDGGSFIDNVAVYDEIITTPPDTTDDTTDGLTTPTGIPGWPDVAIVLGLFTALGLAFFYRRRRKQS